MYDQNLTLPGLTTSNRVALDLTPLHAKSDKDNEQVFRMISKENGLPDVQRDRYQPRPSVH
jgi:hypothetical protein